MGEIAEGAFGGDEAWARLVLWVVTDPPVQTGISDLDEVVPESALLALLAEHPKRNKIHKGVSRFLAAQREETKE